MTMNHDEFDNYLALVSRLLRLTNTQSDAMGDELRDHLETRIAELVESGVEEKTAKLQALEEFGDAASLAQQFQSVLKSYRKRWMMRFTTFAIAGSFLVVLLTFSLWPEGARFGTPNNSVAQDAVNPQTDQQEPTESTRPSKTAELNKITNDILEKTVSFKYDATPFEEVMNELQENFSFNIYLDSSARDDLLTEDEPVTFKITSIRLRKALNLMLREKNATFVVEEGILVIISKDVASDLEYFERKIIDARLLFKQIQLAEKAQKRQGQQPRIQIVLGTTRNGGLGGGGGGVFQVSEKPQDKETKTSAIDSAIDELKKADGSEKQILLKGPFSVVNTNSSNAESKLIDLIRASVETDGWDSTNGEATLSIIGGLIVVYGPHSTIQQVEDLVRDLEYRIMK